MKLGTNLHSYLANPFYVSLTSVHASFAMSQGAALRFHPATIPFAAVPEPTAECIADLLPLLTLGEEIYLTADPGQTVALISGLEIVSILPGVQMRYAAATPIEEDDPTVVKLTRNDTEEMLRLKARAFPGFFGPRAPELGCFFGVRDPKSTRLIAMGGERIATIKEREISGVCTDPEHLGRGYAASIIRTLLRHQAGLGMTSLLHVTATNSRAMSLYKHLGFVQTGTLDFVNLRRI